MICDIEPYHGAERSRDPRPHQYLQDRYLWRIRLM
jgi:hypothetical protein